MSMYQRSTPGSFRFATAAAAAFASSSAPGVSSSKSLETDINFASKTANNVSSETHAHQRPIIELLQKNVSISSEAEAIDRWFDDLSSYEKTMDSMAHASLDQTFKDELSAIEQWFQVLSEAERTATLYSLMQHTTRVQQGFFVAYLQQLARGETPNLTRDSQNKAGGVKAQPRRVSGKPQLVITGTNEKYAKMYGERLEQDYPLSAHSNVGPMTAQPFAGAPRSAGLYTTTTRPKSAQLNAFQTASVWTQNGNPSPGMRSVAEGPTYGNIQPPIDRTQEDDLTIAGAATAASVVANADSRWKPLTPTFSTFEEMAKTIERPRSATDADRGTDVNHSRWSAVSSGTVKPSPVVATRTPLGPPPAGSDRVNFLRPPASARSATGRFMFREPLTADPIHRGIPRPLASPAMPPGLFPSSPTTTAATTTATPTYPSWDSNNKKSTMVRDFSAGLLSDGRLMDTKVGAKEVAAINHMLSSKLNLGSKDKTRSDVGNGEKPLKPQEPIDFDLLEDIPAWLRSMRLHKYTPLFESMTWREMIVMSDEELSEKGVSALGARRKMLKVFEAVKLEAGV